MIWGLIRKLVIFGILVAGVGIAFRQGLIPPQYSPLPPLDLDRSYPLVVDWQLVEVGRDRGLCKRTILQTGINARQIPDKPFEDGCGWENAVGLLSIAGAQFPARPLDCEVAAGLAMWMKHVVQPEAQRLFGEPVVRLGNMGTYSCRNIIGTRFWGNRRSQHATANAVDIGSFRLASGKVISVLDHWNVPDNRSTFLQLVHRGACRYFRVVLGPEYNEAHRNHFHFDRGPFWRCV